MNTNRRNFLKQATIGAGAIATTGFISDPGSKESIKPEIECAVKKSHKQVFNMWAMRRQRLKPYVSVL